MTATVHVVGYLSIDRIETGRDAGDDVPGGAALYAALGARAAGAAVALHAMSGVDFRAEWLQQAATLGIDLAGVVRCSSPTRRARLAYRTDESRDNAHHAQDAWWERTHTLVPAVPAALAAGDVVALMAVPSAVAAKTLAAAAKAGARVVMDTSAAFASAERQAVCTNAAKAHIFAPSLEETRHLCPDCSDDAAAFALAGSGCNVLHKRGAAGAFAVAARAATGLRLAAPPATLRDPTGAGDAVVGALAAGIAAGLDFIAGARAALQIGARCVGGWGPAALGLHFEGSAAS
jgi:sugar/nucleoside kinase (ribokinase family)